jgi:hypothetical protein
VGSHKGVATSSSCTLLRVTTVASCSSPISARRARRSIRIRIIWCSGHGLSHNFISRLVLSRKNIAPDHANFLAGRYQRCDQLFLSDLTLNIAEIAANERSHYIFQNISCLPDSRLAAGSRFFWFASARMRRRPFRDCRRLPTERAFSRNCKAAFRSIPWIASR